MHMTHVNKMVLRIQSKFRQKLALSKIAKEIERDKAKLARRK